MKVGIFWQQAINCYVQILTFFMFLLCFDQQAIFLCLDSSCWRCIRQSGTHGGSYMLYSRMYQYWYSSSIAISIFLSIVVSVISISISIGIAIAIKRSIASDIPISIAITISITFRCFFLSVREFPRCSILRRLFSRLECRVNWDHDIIAQLLVFI